MVEFANPTAARLFFANCASSGRDRLAVAEHGYSLRYTDPAAMLAWCEAAAVNLPSTLPPLEAGLLLALLGNAHRVSCNFAEAENHLRQALEASPSGPRVLEFFAALMKETGQLGTASEYLSRAALL